MQGPARKTNQNISRNRMRKDDGTYTVTRAPEEGTCRQKMQSMGEGLDQRMESKMAERLGKGFERQRQTDASRREDEESLCHMRLATGPTDPSSQWQRNE